MLEAKEYTKEEISSILKTSDTQGIKRKLERYGVEYSVSGRGRLAKFTILNIPNPFKIFCITELGFDAKTDFYKALYFFYLFFINEEFRSMPDEVKEHRMDKINHHVSRQTITHYEKKLENENWIAPNSSNYIYYFAYHNEQRITNRNEYLEAWRGYWKDIEDEKNPGEARFNMIQKYGGMARKQAVQELNGIYADRINYFIKLVEDEMQKRFESDTEF